MADSRHRFISTITFWCAVTALSWFTVRVPFLMDDAYIVLFNASVLVTGQDPIYGQPALVGSTSPLFTSVVALLQILGLDSLNALRTVCAAGIAAYAIGVWRLTSLAVSGWRRVAVCAIGLTSAWLWRVLPNGLETGAATALVVWLLVWWQQGRVWPLAIGCGLLPCLRPELAPLSAVLGIGAVWTRPWRTRVLTASVALAVAAPWFIWLALNTGTWWPQTLTAKRMFFAEDCRPLPEKLQTFTIYLGLWGLMLIPLSLGLLLAFRGTLGRLGAIGVGVVLGAFALALPAGIVANDFRYLTPVLVPWAVYGLTRIAVAPQPLLRVGLGACAGLSVVLLLTTERPPSQAVELQATAAWIDTHTPPDALVLAHDAGAIAYFGHRRVVDVIGLKSPASTPFHARWTYPTCGTDRWRAIAAIAEQTGATYAVSLPALERFLELRTGLQRAGVHLTTVREGDGEWSYTIDRIEAPPDPD